MRSTKILFVCCFFLLGHFFGQAQCWGKAPYFRNIFPKSTEFLEVLDLLFEKDFIFSNNHFNEDKLLYLYTPDQKEPITFFPSDQFQNQYLKEEKNKAWRDISSTATQSVWDNLWRRNDPE